MKKLTFLISLITLSITLFAQDSIFKQNSFIYGFSGGVNFTNFIRPNLKLEPEAQPNFGLFQNIRLIEPIGIKLSESYTFRSSVGMMPFQHIRDKYIDLAIMPRLRLFQTIDIYGGVIGNFIPPKKVYETIDSEFNFIFGAEIRLQQRLRLEASYQAHNEYSGTYTISCKLNYIINPKKVKRTRYHAIVRKKLQNDLNSLNNGLLLVRLKTATNTINAYKSKGLNEAAEKLEMKRRDENLQIVKAFRENYHFSRVEFFFSSDSKKVEQGDFYGIFLNDSLVHDSSIKADTANIWYIAEVDFLESVTGKRWESSYNTDSTKPRKIYYTTSSDFSRAAIVIRDKNFEQLRRPFPYYVSCQSEAKMDPPATLTNHLVKRSVFNAVQVLDEKLTHKLDKIRRRF
ncbi:MAG TPA: hypothetical protein VK212_11095 [Lentimicrobium sp.]|nr:hypothetical protein [Lentimicrobium sp.]